MANSRDSYNLKKIQKFNKIDQTYDKDSLKQREISNGVVITLIFSAL